MRGSARWVSILAPVCAVFALSKVHAKWIASPSYDFTASFRLSWALAFIALLIVAVYAVGLPELARSARQAIALSIAATGAATIVVSAIQLVVGDSLLPRFVVFGAALLMIPIETLASGLARRDRARSEDRDRVLLIGDKSTRERLLDDLRLEPERAATLVASIDVVGASQTQPRSDTAESPLRALYRTSNATVLVLDGEAHATESIIIDIARLHESGVRVRTLQRFYEEWLGKLPVADLERASLLFDIGEVHRPRYVRFKRLLDLSVAASGVAALALVIPIVAMCNRFANRGPLFYRQPRIGKGGAVFTILKFRTMTDATGATTTHWTENDDPRITRFGGLLRRTHIDELPQVVNILRGDLSIVGPRPEQPHYVEELSSKLPYYNHRHLVRPGLTGWAQVKYGYAGDESDALEKLQYDFYYLAHQGLTLDLRVLARTARTVVGRGGR